MSRAIDVVVDGKSLSSICYWEGLSWTSRWPYGDYEASCRISTQKNWRHSALKQGKPFRVMYGGKPLFRGVSGEHDFESGELRFEGLIRRGEDYLALHYDADAAEIKTTFDVAVAIDEAITPPTALGRVPIGWRRRDPSVTGIFRPDGNNNPTILDLLDEAMKRGAGTPYLGPDNRIALLPDPTAYDWMVHPNVVDLSEAGGETRATRIRVTYLAATGLSFLDNVDYPADSVVIYKGELWKRLGHGAGDIPGVSQMWVSLGTPSEFEADATYSIGDYVTKSGSIYRSSADGNTGHTPPAAGWWTLVGAFPVPAVVVVGDRLEPYREVSVDITELGDLPTAEATDIANKALAEGLAPVFTTDIPITPLVAKNRRGRPADPLLPHAGQLVRVWGAAHPHLGHGYIDVIAGEVTVSNAETSPTAVIKPYLKPARGLVEAMEAALTARRRAA